MKQVKRAGSGKARARWTRGTARRGDRRCLATGPGNQVTATQLAGLTLRHPLPTAAGSRRRTPDPRRGYDPEAGVGAGSGAAFSPGTVLTGGVIAGGSIAGGATVGGGTATTGMAGATAVGAG